MTDPKKFTNAYFLEQCLEMRHLFGSIDFWDRTEEEQDAAMNGLFYVYLHCEHEEGDASTFEATSMEFTQRRELVKRRPPS